MTLFTDGLKRLVNVIERPQRIVSLVPSQTELLFHLGLRDEVVGITKFCIHPKEWHQTKTRIGGTKTANLEKIKSLQPDLILANKEENVREQIDELAKHFPVWISDVNSLEDAYEMIQNIGQIIGKETVAKQLLDKIKTEFQSLDLQKEKRRTSYLIWKDPYMTVGGDTFIHDMMNKAGFENLFADQTRYPVVTVAELESANCDLLLLSSEPYPFKQKHIDELSLQLPTTKIVLVDGEMFSWYGSRLQYVPAYFKALRKQISGVL
jgi:ABC-type Fe3+-hydroxamate transport system substrate-binding protein